MRMTFLRGLFLKACLALVLLLIPATAQAEGPRKDRLIVFVHGIFGDIESTFKAKDAEETWPEIVAHDSTGVFDDADIVTFNFDTSLAEEGTSIQDIAQLMRTRLERSDIGIREYGSVIFVVHSMGGIVVRQYLLDESRRPDGGALSDNRIKGLLLFGTPMNGSAVAQVGSKIFTSRTLWQLSDEKNPDSYLTSLREQWIKAGLGMRVRSDCYYETRDEEFFNFIDIIKLGIAPADRNSVEPLCNMAFGGLPESHSTLVKPVSERDYRHDILREFYLSIFGDAREKLGSSGIAIARCGANRFSETIIYEVAKKLRQEGLDYHLTRYLPFNWPKEDGPIGLISKSALPQVLLIHWSCFQQGDESKASVEEAAVDFNNFLRQLGPNNTSVVLFSRASRSGIRKSLWTDVQKGFPDKTRFEHVKLEFHEQLSSEQLTEIFTKLKARLKK